MMYISFTKVNQEELLRLIDSYYGGVTSVKDEKRLYKLLMHPSLKESYHAERAMLSYFKAERPSVKVTALTVLRRVAVVALLVVSGMFVVQYTTPKLQASYAYVNGVRVTDLATIRSEAISSLNDMPGVSTHINMSLTDVSSGQLIEEQLSVFSTIE